MFFFFFGGVPENYSNLSIHNWRQKSKKKPLAIHTMAWFLGPQVLGSSMIHFVNLILFEPHPSSQKERIHCFWMFYSLMTNDTFIMDCHSL